MEEPDDFERMLDFCIEQVYQSLKDERNYLWKKLIDRSFGDDITNIISKLYVMRADMHAAYRSQKNKLNK